MKKLIIIGLFFCSIFFPDYIYAKQNTDCKVLEQIFKTKVEAADGVCKVRIVRKNLDVMHMGKKVSQEMMDLAFDLAFEKVDEQMKVMGEMALLQNEVNPVLDELRKGGLEITAIHNHWLNEKPRIIYLHFQGKGDMIKEANSIINAIAVTKELKLIQQSADPLP
ncbi:DUF1259 domain-containing protein [Neobacillus notoginsengisoli]|uniref:DUF1259 domain-containing protein n=1 Tax=Neobacillus notoginsengisoli TaxID=1578198 RepID=A0A417YWR9_9BACI|nr:DUF1259 domain-containing protein [Neobacillus notoginsengisoli]RHW41691.1 DUF1259 domain-containing protein [Neobacillus notoginsengisoli]